MTHKWYNRQPNRINKYILKIDALEVQIMFRCFLQSKKLVTVLQSLSGSLCTRGKLIGHQWLRGMVLCLAVIFSSCYGTSKVLHLQIAESAKWLSLQRIKCPLAIFPPYAWVASYASNLTLPDRKVPRDGAIHCYLSGFPRNKTIAALSIHTTPLNCERHTCSNLIIWGHEACLGV